jgi:hypothetical protein
MGLKRNGKGELVIRRPLFVSRYSFFVIKNCFNSLTPFHRKPLRNRLTVYVSNFDVRISMFVILFWFNSLTPCHLKPLRNRLTVYVTLFEFRY